MGWVSETTFAVMMTDVENYKTAENMPEINHKTSIFATA